MFLVLFCWGVFLGGGSWGEGLQKRFKTVFLLYAVGYVLNNSFSVVCFSLIYSHLMCMGFFSFELIMFSFA